jgi:RHH-type proline utilization regulon transcriptional repressor/proline dehydrogenase/delta 1-pyrroline-5-carboxylate dehydrogenase
MPRRSAVTVKAAVNPLDPRIQELGQSLMGRPRSARRWWSRFTHDDALLTRLMSDPHLRAAALRFVDVLPALADDGQLTAHLDEYFHDLDLPLPRRLGQWTLRHARGPIVSHAVAPIVRALAGRLARRFIAGHDRESADRALSDLWRHGMGFTLDLLGEAVVSDAEAMQYQKRYLDLLADLSPRVAAWPALPLMDRIGDRVAPRLNLSIKVSALHSQIDSLDPDGSVAVIKDRLRPILLAARLRGAFITVDMEQYATKRITLRIFRELLSEPALADWPDAGLAMQAYLRDTPADVAAMIDWAKGRGTPVMIRLVRGAYWDYETVVARQHGWPIPVWTQKAQTDVCYEHCLALLFEAHPHVQTAVATHNVRSMAVAMALAEQHQLKPNQYEMQMLLGMADPIKQRLVAAGQRLRVYVPFGELIPGMAYLVRRLLENTASQSFLRMGFTEGLPVEQLMSVPIVLPENPPPPLAVEGFVNEPERRFVDEHERAEFAAALERVGRQLGQRYPLFIGDSEVDTGEWIVSTNPASPTQMVGEAASAGAAEVDEAVKAAGKALEKWRATPVRQRCEILRRAADLLRAQRDDFSAWEAYECAKPWRDADGDVVEAIDYLNYYAMQAEKLWAGHKLDVPGETNRYFYEPRGVGAVIAPWNFPLAILVGMSAGPIAAGNTVVMKPAPQSPIVAARFANLMREAGLPDGVLNYLPGGDEAGEALVKHPGVHFINFTGSRAVGLLINRAAAEVPEGQKHLKHVVAELGGKNAIIVDADADLDDAVTGTVFSAFAYAGQKCSACSRVIVVGELYDGFVKRLGEAAASLRIGPATDAATFVPPVIDAEAKRNILAAIERGKSEARCVLSVDVSALGEGHYVGPTIFADVPPQSSLAQREIFGPVLSVMKAPDFGHAIELANGVDYALTGGVYSRSPANLDRARAEFRVGNLYLNRRITGAVVGRQPFGGMKMSGTDAKAGGPDYLLHFVEARCVTENTIRRGFAAERD